MLKTCVLIATLCGVMALGGCPWGWWRSEENRLRGLVKNLYSVVKLQADFEMGIEQFKEGKDGLAEPARAHQAFRHAMLHFQSCAARERPELYRNVGNSAYLANELPKAIIAFHRATRLLPNDELAGKSLDFVRGTVQYPEGNRGRPASSVWPSWLPRPTLDVCRIITLLAYALFCVVGTRWLMTRQRWWFTASAVAASVCFAAGLGWWHGDRAECFEREHPLVVVAADAVPLFTGNGISYPRHPTLPTLYRGMEARRLHQRGDWLQVQFGTGEVGWVQRQQVLVDEP